MHLILRYPRSRRIEALLLAATAGRMRVVVKHLKDTVEFTLVDGRWISDRGCAAEIESITTDDPGAIKGIWRETRRLVVGAAL